METRNVALFGKFCAGKTTLAYALEDLGFSRVSMAANMKQIVLDAYGTLDKGARVDVTRRDGTVETVTIRDVLQGLGEAVKTVDRDLWLRWLLRDTEVFRQPLVMDDARLLFEADALRKRGWLLVKVDTPDHVRILRHMTLYGSVPTEAQMFHTTEVELENVAFDMVVDGITSPGVVAESIAMAAEGAYEVPLL